MKFSLSVAAALFGAISVFSTQSASAEPCTGPFRQCAIQVNATCSRDADGKQRMTYWDYAGNTTLFERCVAGIFAAAGQPNPYTPEGAAAVARGRTGGLTVPYSELLYPMEPNR
jgi:hypothetical protein